MALKESQPAIRRVGYDSDSHTAKAALGLGAVDEIKNPKSAVREAGIVLLCLPLAAIKETLQQIGPELKEGAVVMDTAPVKGGVAAWAKEFLPQGRFYLGLVPALSARAISSLEAGLEAAQPDLFQRGLFVVDAPPGTPGEAVGMALDLCRTLGAKPMLADMAESDGLMAAAHILPQLTAAALLNATIDQPGWAEGRKLAGRPFTGVTSGVAIHDDPASLRAAALAGKMSVVHALDTLMAALKGLRDDIASGDEQSLSERLMQAAEGRERWLVERSRGEWLNEGGEAPDVPGIGEWVGNALFGRTILDRAKKKK